MADQFEAALVQGYSPEISFGRTSWRPGGVELLDINWKSSLQRFKSARSQGKSFPLRTPEFNLTERGVELLVRPNPEQYGDLHARYRLGELYGLLAEMGADLWEPSPLLANYTVCMECGTPFERAAPKKVYCSERCRKKAKNRRCRERDPERARQWQAKYWKSYGEPN